MKPWLLVTGLLLLSKPLLQAEEPNDQFTRIDDSIPLLREKVRQLTAAEELLKARLKEALSAQPAAVDPRELARADEKNKALEKEIEVLKVNLAKSESKPDKPVDPAVLEETRKDLSAARQKLAQQTELLDALTLGKEALEKRLKSFINGTEIKSLRDEIESLKRQAHDLKSDEDGGSQPGLTAKVRLLERELAEVKAVAQSRAAMVSALQTALQARNVPFSAEKLALVQSPEPGPGKGSSRSLPTTAEPLVAEAERAFAARRYEEAERKYLLALRFNATNVAVLANLAAAQIEQGRLTEAENNLKKALAVIPKDGFSLSLLGIVKLRQGNHDEAFVLVSQAVELDPQNAEGFENLGVVLAEKGLREPAESAFRRAIQLAPGHAEAHHNIAVLYATERTPALELARWHYQKSLERGHARDAKLERMLKR